MFVLYILCALVLLLGVVLCLSVKVELGFEGDFKIKAKFLNFTLYPMKKRQKSKPQKQQLPKNEKKPKTKNLFEKLVEAKGFKGAVSELFLFFKSVIEPLKTFLKRLKFKKVCVKLSVVGADAAQTAVDYGVVCSVVYPVLSFFESVADVKYKNIDIRSDFTGKESEFGFSLFIKAKLIFILIFGFKIFKEYKNFSVRNDLQ